MLSLHHDGSPWQVGRIGLRAVTHAAQNLRQCHMHVGQVAVPGTWGESGYEFSTWGLLADLKLCALNFGLKTIRAVRAEGQQPLLWHGWCSFRVFFLEMPMYQIGEARRAQDSRPSSFETYCQSVTAVR